MIVLDLVWQGCYLYCIVFGGWNKVDIVVVEQVLVLILIGYLCYYKLDMLLGGQWQWVWIVMIFVQQGGILLLDELIIYLDFVYQIDLLELVCDLIQMQGMMVVVVLYDLNQVVCYVDYFVLLKDGCIYFSGIFMVILIVLVIVEVFGVEVVILIDFEIGMLFCLLCKFCIICKFM